MQVVLGEYFFKTIYDSEANSLLVSKWSINGGMNIVVIVKQKELIAL